MYDINIYYKNQDPHCKHDVVYHNYNHYNSFEEAYDAYMEFYKTAKENGFDDAYIFAVSMPRELINSIVLKSNKDLFTIVKK